MRRVEVLLIAAFERNMGGDQRAVLEDAYLVGEYVNIEDTATCGVGDAIEIAADVTMPSWESRRSSFNTVR